MYEILERNEYASRRHELTAEIREIVRSSYIDARPLVDRELAFCDTAYLHRAEAGAPILSFFLTGRCDVTLEGTAIPTVYLGLSGTRQKQSGSIRGLYAFQNEHVIKESGAALDKLIFWFTTASPSAVFAGHNIYSDAEPTLDGSYSDESARLARALAAVKGAEQNDNNPFVWRGAAGLVRYSKDEVLRIQDIERRHAFTLLTDLGIHEGKGDRLLIICRPNRLRNTASV